ncbi:MAG: hypothetical protein EA378_00170, partial [Phycisphaerales bacterium]
MRVRTHRRSPSLCAALLVPVLAAFAAPAQTPREDCQPAWVPTFVGGNSISSSVFTQAVFDDGNGEALYVGGGFITAGGQAVNRIARWNGSAWSPLGSDVNNSVIATAVFNDGNTEALYIGGTFTTVSGQPITGIARWDGASWSAVGTGLNGNVFALGVHDDGTGPALYAGGSFTVAGGASANRIAKWNGTTWSPLGGGVEGSVLALQAFNDGSGDALYVGGSFTFAGGEPVSGIAKWDGSAWSTLASGVGGGASTPQVRDFAVYDDGTGPALYAAGLFASASATPATSRIARWDGSAWSSVGGGITGTGFNQGVYTLSVYDDGSGPGLYAGGDFFAAGGVSTSLVARWDPTGWSPLGAGMQNIDFAPYVRTIGVYDDGAGSGAALFVGGDSVGAPGGGNFLGKWQGCPIAETPCPADLTGPALDGIP